MTPSPRWTRRSTASTVLRCRGCAPRCWPTLPDCRSRLATTGRRAPRLASRPRRSPGSTACSGRTTRRWSNGSSATVTDTCRGGDRGPPRRRQVVDGDPRRCQHPPARLEGVALPRPAARPARRREARARHGRRGRGGRHGRRRRPPNHGRRRSAPGRGGPRRLPTPHRAAAGRHRGRPRRRPPGDRRGAARTSSIRSSASSPRRSVWAGAPATPRRPPSGPAST